MPRSNKKNLLVIIFAVAVFVGIAFFISLIQNGAMPDQNGSSVQTISTPEIMFGVPKDFGLAISQEQILVKSYIPPCDSDFDYCLYYNGTAYTGTNFEGAGVRIKKRTDLVSRESCLTSFGYESLTPVTRNSGTYATSIFAPLGDAAAGHFTVGELYRVHFGNTCYEFQARIGQARFENYEPGLIREFTAQASEELQGKLRAIVLGIRITEGVKQILFPPAGN